MEKIKISQVRDQTNLIIFNTFGGLRELQLSNELFNILEKYEDDKR